MDQKGQILTMLPTETQDVQKEINPYIITFSKPYRFEDKEYTDVDMSKLEDLSSGDLTLAEKMFTASQNISIVAELNLGYCLCVASVATGKPLEFFNKLPAREGMKIKNAVALFFLNGE